MRGLARRCAFAGLIRHETETLVRRLQASPSLAVVCGGSEVGQQAAMMGLARPMRDVPLGETVIPAIVAQACDAVYVPGSPSGGSLPFVAEAGFGLSWLIHAGTSRTPSS